MTRLWITDRVTGELVGELDPGDPVDGTSRQRPGPESDQPLVLAAAVPSASRGRTAVEVVIAGWRFEFEVEDARLAELRHRATAGDATNVHDGPTEVRAIIPGRVVSVAVTVGDTVIAGQRLLAVEAMKMVNELRAPRDGTIERIAAATGQTVELGDLLAVIR